MKGSSLVDLGLKCLHLFLMMSCLFLFVLAEISAEMQMILKFRSTMVKDVCNKLQGIPGLTQERVVHVTIQVRGKSFDMEWNFPNKFPTACFT